MNKLRPSKDDLKFILNFKEMMQPGDVILTASPTFSSFGIRKITKSEFSHAILYLGDSYMHSDLDGVHSGNPQRLLFKSPNHVKVLRLKKEYLNTQTIERICAFARAEHGKQYSKFEAAQSVFTPKLFNQQNRQFCSRLVAQSFENADIKIVKDSNYCTPHDIASSNYFDEVINVSRLASSEEIEFANSDNPLIIQMNIVNKLLQDVRELTGYDIQTPNDIDRILIENQSYDLEITEILRKSGYLEIWKIDYEKNPWRYNKDLFIKYENYFELKKFIKATNNEYATYDDLRIAMAIGELSLFSGDTVSVNEGLRFQHQYNMYCILYENYKLDYFHNQILLYEQLLKNCSNRIAAAENILRYYNIK